MRRSYKTKNRLDRTGQALVASLSEYAVTIRFGSSVLPGQMDYDLYIWYPHAQQPPIVHGAFSNETLRIGLERVVNLATSADEDY